ncbi:MAG: pyridoxamine 5'-phosphate oxidase family protein [Pseudomonadota bacterium]
MTEEQRPNPFHAGERTAQERAGVGDVAQWAGGFIRDALPAQHRAFHTALPFLVFAGADGEGNVWTTILDGEEGFIQSPDPKHLVLDSPISEADPLAGRFAEGGDIGGLGIELATRRRNRFSGRIAPGGEAVTIEMRQTFGNCPQYIPPRGLSRAPRGSDAKPERRSALTREQMTMIRQADTVFIGSGHHGEVGAASNGYDASHRGGAPGFVHVAGPTRLLIPDYAGNNFFNTIGNLVSDPRVGLLFVDFSTGGLLHLTGRASVDWSPRQSHDPDARRMIEVEIDAVLERPAALSLRWHALDDRARKLRLARRERESEHITSFYFAPLDGRPLDPFEPGQHLPIAVQIPGQSGMTKRSYSLSGSASDLTHYRLSVKREPDGLMSRFLHDDLRVGDIIEAMPPAGEFVLPNGNGPVVLISAGVGLTPMVSMLHALAGTDRKAWYVHAARNGRERAMGGEVADLIARHDNLQKRVFFSRPDDEDHLGADFDEQGRLSANAIFQLSEEEDVQFLLCGPAPFLTDLKTGLEDLGVPSDNIHFETFGPS